jgi:catechol 2,3-dioxygenase-like lactoylglutathione lyase family enzyme
MVTVNVRYIVDDVKAAIEFYTRHLGFRVDIPPAPGFALLAREDLRLMLNEPGVGGAGQAMPDGQLPRAGGWNRMQLRVADLDTLYASLKNQGVRFRNGITEGQGGRQVLLQDPSGNLIELFEAGKAEPTVMSPVFSGIFLTTENPPENSRVLSGCCLDQTRAGRQRRRVCVLESRAERCADCHPRRQQVCCLHFACNRRIQCYSSLLQD